MWCVRALAVVPKVALNGVCTAVEWHWHAGQLAQGASGEQGRATESQRVVCRVPGRDAWSSHVIHVLTLNGHKKRSSPSSSLK